MTLNDFCSFTALADAFIDFSVRKGAKPFKVAWYKSDTTVTINYLKAGIVDVGITYSEIAETLAINASIAKSPSYYAFRDHFILVGPSSNPANISNTTKIETIFSDLYNAAESPIATDPPVRFLSRYDKSATNLKESALWIGLGQVSDVGMLPCSCADLDWQVDPMGNCIFDLVSPIHCLSDTSLNCRHSSRRIYNH